ncbi:Rad17 cell cycle checkpoint protein-domain-containing protein [Tuber indicum]|nr:Rad17 cell cycle checkpoint protein-domain-containing protein [Tuber indicum]
MPAPAPKKRKVVIEISDDDNFEGELSITTLSSAPQRQTRASTRRTAASSTAPAAVNDSIPSKPLSSQTKAARRAPTAANAAPLKPKANNSTVRRSTASLQKKTPASNKPIYSFFTSAHRPPSSSSQNARVSVPPASQNEDFDDLIEDGFSDHGFEGSSAASVGTRAGSLSGAGRFKVGRGGATRKGRAEEGKGSSSVKTTSGAQIVDPRPWPERFAPQSSNSLAVNQKKVAEVRSWFEHVFDGFSKQRLLVLKGSAGSGKTAVLEVLSKEMGFEVLEWKNPSGAIPTEGPDEGNAFSSGLTGVFEEFVGRAGRFGSLNMVSTAPSRNNARGKKPVSDGSLSETDESKKKVILIEDFPNALFTSSPAPLASFRHTIKSFLALPAPPRFSPPVPPLVLIISESANISGSGAFTAHRLLSPEILHHPLATSITFNKIAPTFMIKALSAIITQESRESSRRFGPSNPVLQALSSSGDIRSAIMGLEFLAVNGEGGAFSEKVDFNERAKRRKASGEGGLNEVEREILNTVTQRESSLGLFHAVGRVVYNKRYGDDPGDPYMPPPPKPPLPHIPFRARASRVDLDGLMDEAGTDPQTFISGLHENYLGSCNHLGGLSRIDYSMEDSLTCVISCIEGLSDSDLLASPKPYHRILGRLGGYEGGDAAVGSAGIRQDEISFQTAVRGVLLGLPTPVRRESRDTKMYYSTALRLWRDQEEVEGLIDLFSKRLQTGGNYGDIGGDGTMGTDRAELAMERMPYSKIILKARQQRKATTGPFNRRVFEMSGKSPGIGVLKELEKATNLKGVAARRSEDVPCHDDHDGMAQGASSDELEAADERNRLHSRRYNTARNHKKGGRSKDLDATMRVERLVLSDDDIEDDW